MQGLYSNNNIYSLYNALLINLDASIRDRYDAIDDMLKLILLNNGCKISENNLQLQRKVFINEEYILCFVSGMIGNDANEYYDFIIFNGMKYLIVFIDYFNGISNGIYNSQDPMLELKISMGNSVYYDAIKKIVEIFYLTSEPMPGGLLTTAMVTTQRWNQAIIAIHILNGFKPIDENDVSDIPMQNIKDILNGNIELQLYGIRAM